MLHFGTNITAPSDTLQPVSVEDFYNSLRSPKPRIRQLVDQLRIMQTLDKASYRIQKKLLPYIVCASFKPAIRRRENFLYIEHFIVDLDGITAHFDKGTLWEKLISDPQLMLLFTSPGSDGLKLLFRMEQKCTDYGLFSAFYKFFVHSLALRYHLQNVIDTSTSDVTRACFISYDENAWYNAEAQPVNMNSYLNTNDPDTLWEAAKNAETALNKLQEGKEEPAEKNERPAPGSDVMSAIRQKLNPDFRKPPQKQYYIPPEVEDYTEKIKAELERCDLSLLESSPINYGRKLKIGAGTAWAEINLFYGKRGFTFVKTTKTGSNAELADLCVKLLEQHLYGSNNNP